MSIQFCISQVSGLNLDIWDNYEEELVAEQLIVEPELLVAVPDTGDYPAAHCRCLSLPLPLDESAHSVDDLLI